MEWRFEIAEPDPDHTRVGSDTQPREFLRTAHDIFGPEAPGDAGQLGDLTLLGLNHEVSACEAYPSGTARRTRWPRERAWSSIYIGLLRAWLRVREGPPLGSPARFRGWHRSCFSISQVSLQVIPPQASGA